METDKKDYHGQPRKSGPEVRHVYNKTDGHLTIEVSHKAQNERLRDYDTSSGD
ncbi:hypothetical protein J6X09_02690 [Candidatus Saccharibacteria bacterium]|nr:hypothetical protein [Candidatus Saccharibacteria bacterium]